MSKIPACNFNTLQYRKTVQQPYSQLLTCSLLSTAVLQVKIHFELFCRCLNISIKKYHIVYAKVHDLEHSVGSQDYFIKILTLRDNQCVNLMIYGRRHLSKHLSECVPQILYTCFWKMTNRRQSSKYEYAGKAWIALDTVLKAFQVI